MTDTVDRTDEVREVERIIIRFAGDSGDGMQLTGDRFTSASALFGNDLATLPEFPAEIRAPAGTLAGVSAFQVHISDHDITTPGDAPNVLVAMNPAALKADLHTLESGGTVIINLTPSKSATLPRPGTSTIRSRTHPRRLHRDHGADDLAHQRGLQRPRREAADAERSKNFFALGLVSWLYSRPEEPTMLWIQEKFKGRDLVIARTKRRTGQGMPLAKPLSFPPAG